MTDDEAMEATLEFARDVAKKAMRHMRADYTKGGRAAEPAKAFQAVHSGIAAAFSLGYEAGRAQTVAERITKGEGNG